MLRNSSELVINIYLYLMIHNSDSYYWNFTNFKVIYGFARAPLTLWCLGKAWEISCLFWMTITRKLKGPLNIHWELRYQNHRKFVVSGHHVWCKSLNLGVLETKCMVPSHDFFTENCALAWNSHFFCTTSQWHMSKFGMHPYILPFLAQMYGAKHWKLVLWQPPNLGVFSVTPLNRYSGVLSWTAMAWFEMA